MLRVGGSLTDIENNSTNMKSASHTMSKTMPKSTASTMSGGGLTDDLMNGINKITSTPEVVPKVQIPDNSITEDFVPDAKMTDIIIEQARDIDESSFSATAILNAIIAYMAKVLFIGFDIENKMIHNGLLAFLWLGIAGSLFAIAIAIPNTNITFIMYCSAIWIIALAILFVILQPYRVA
jgi:hypothetical protein